MSYVVQKINPIHIAGLSLMENEKPRSMSIVGISTYTGKTRCRIVTGKATTPDLLHFSGAHKDKNGKQVVAVQRLFKGRYGDAYVLAEDLLKALQQAECFEEADHLRQRMEDWNLDSKV